MKNKQPALSPLAATHKERIIADLAMERSQLDADRNRLRLADARLLEREQNVDRDAVLAAQEAEARALHERNCNLSERLRLAMVRVAESGPPPAERAKVDAALAYYGADDEAVRMAMPCGTREWVERALVWLHIGNEVAVENERQRAERQAASDAMQQEWILNRQVEDKLEGRV